MATSGKPISKETTVTLGVIATFLGTSIAAVVYLSSMKSSVDSMATNLIDFKRSLDRNTAQIVSDGREVSSLRSTVEALRERIRLLEAR